MKRDLDYYLQKVDELSAREPAPQVSRPQDIYAYLRAESRARQEKFIVVTLDGAHVPIRKRTIFIGTVNRSIVHPREVFAPAISDRAAAIIVAHNHPSGNLDPSPEDNQVTHRLKEAGEILGISVLDHLIISKTGYRSYAEMGRL